MPAPSIAIDESNVGTRRVVAPALSKIGLVGLFPFGPKNVAKEVTSLAEAVQQFCPQYVAGATGIPSLYGIYAQNANAVVEIVNIEPTSAAGVKASLNLSNATPTVIAAAQAIATGPEYNQITAQVSNPSDGVSTHWKLTLVQVTTGQSEVWDNLDTNASNNNLAAAGGPAEPGKGSKWVNLTKSANGRPVNSGPTNLAGGTLGTAQASDYVGTVAGDGTKSGLYALDPVVDVRYILAAQMGGDATVQSGLQTYVAGRSVGAGLVMGILNPPSGQDPATVSIGSLDSKRLGMFWPWLKSSAVPTALQNTWIAPDGFVAGLLSTLKPNRSTINKQLQGVTDLQYAPSDAQVDTLSDKRVNAITAVRGRGIRVRDGLTLSSDSAWSFWEMRAEYDAVETALWDGYAWVVGEPNIPGILWPQVESQGDAVLSAAQDDGTIVAYRPTKVVNTPDDTAAGKLIVEAQAQFTVDARFVTIRIERVVDASAS